MSNYLKPQSPLYHKKEDAYFYPLTTADQVIMEDGSRLNTVFKSTVRKIVTLLAANWSADAPYTQTVTVSDVNFDDLNVDVNVAYTGNKESDLELNKDYSCISYVKKNGNSVTFSCLKDKPAIDIPVEIVGTSCDSIATVEEGTKLNFDIAAYDTEEELLADTPMENTIGIVTTTSISKWIFDSNEPENPVDGMLWIKVGTESQVEFNVIKDTDIPIYPISAEQYVNGAWVDVSCFSFIDDEWVSWWNGELYEPDNQYENVTGGWIVVNGSGSNASFTDGGIEFSITGSSGRQSTVYTKNRIDLTNYTKVTVIGNFSTVTEIMLCVTNYNDNSNPKDFIVSTMKTSSGELTLELDVSAVSSSYYIAVVGNKCDGLVTKIYIE